MIESAADLFCKPKVPYSINTWHIDGKQVLEIDVPASNTKPHKAPFKDKLWRAYIRVHDNNIIANSIMIDVWRKQSKRNGVLLRYGNKEKQLLNFLRENNEISQSQFRKLARINHHLSKKILSDLITLNVLQINFSGKKVTYSLNEAS
jgi:predicted HTH transcriptional regulator